MFHGYSNPWQPTMDKSQPISSQARIIINNTFLKTIMLNIRGNYKDNTFKKIENLT